MAVIGLDAGGTKILAGVVDDSGKILCSKKYPMKRGVQEEAIGTIFGALDDFITSIKGADLPPLTGIGMGTTGHIDFENGVIVSCIGTPVTTPVPVRRLLEPKYGLPVRIDNDVHCAATGEYVYGEGKDCKSLLYINVGTGLASSLVENGRLLRGAVNATGESGYFHMNLDGDPEEEGIVEFVAAGGGLILEARKKLAKYPDSVLNRHEAEGTLHAGTIFEAAQAGDELAGWLADRAVRYMGAWLGGLLGTLNPEKVVFGGGVVKNEWFFSRVREETKKRAFVPITWDDLRYFGVTHLNSDHVGLIGAAALFSIR